MTKVKTVADLVHDRRNPRKHNERNLKVIVDSLHDVGFARSIVIDENNEILAGNGVTEAAVLAGIEKVVEVEADGNTIIAVRRTGLSDEQKQRLKYFDNRSGELAGWDAEILLADLQSGVDLSGMFQQDELDALLDGLIEKEPMQPAEDPGAQTDKAEELQAKWQVNDGDLWQIGEHFAICGDCRQPETWQRLLNAAGADKVNGVFTSPPYAMQRKDQYGGVPTDEYVDWWEALQANVKANLAQDGSFFVNIKENSEDYIRQIYVSELAVAMVKRWGWIYLDMFCWERAGIPGDPFKMGKFKNQWEPVYWWSTTTRPKFNPDAVMHESNEVILDDNYKPTLALNQGKGGNSVMGNRKVGKGMAYPGNRLSIHAQDESLGHSAAFPVALPDFFVRAYSDVGDIWLDPFLGSGTTIVAAHQNKRRGLGSEKLPKYMAVILERLQTVTGQTPVLIDSFTVDKQ